jgi:hypothetical protein
MTEGPIGRGVALLRVINNELEMGLLDTSNHLRVLHSEELRASVDQLLGHCKHTKLFLKRQEEGGLCIWQHALDSKVLVHISMILELLRATRRVTGSDSGAEVSARIV